MELESPVTTSIALHHFTAWARYEEVWETAEPTSSAALCVVLLI